MVFYQYFRHIEPIEELIAPNLIKELFGNSGTLWEKKNDLNKIYTNLLAMKLACGVQCTNKQIKRPADLFIYFTKLLHRYRYFFMHSNAIKRK